MISTPLSPLLLHIPQPVRRYARKQLIKLYLHHRRQHQARLQRRRNLLRVLSGHTRHQHQPNKDHLSSLSDMSSDELAWSSEVPGDSEETDTSSSSWSSSGSSSNLSGSPNANRYEAPRNGLPRGPSYLRHVLTVQKAQRADHFRQALRVSPQTFDKIVDRLIDDPVGFSAHIGLV